MNRLHDVALSAERVSKAVQFSSRGWLSRCSLIGDGPTVSLTSYGPRLGRVHLTIESIARGTCLPSRLILWVANSEINRVSPALERLRARGLEILSAQENWGPHRKYFPYCQLAGVDSSKPLVTADDDVFYPPTWLGNLRAALAVYPQDILAYRARTIVFQADGTPAQYASWPLARSSRASYRNIPTGVSGVGYPSALFPQLRSLGTQFLQVAPRADDLWLHAQAVRANIRVRQLSEHPTTFPETPFSQRIALWRENVSVGNDDVVAKLYSSADLAKIAADV